MYDLDTFRQRVHDLCRRATPYDQRHPTQRDLAEAVSLSLSELSRRLNGKRDAKLTERDIHAIVRILGEWGAITTQAEAYELFALLDCPPFTAAEWQSPPLDTLIPSAMPPVTLAVSHPSALTHNLPAPLTSFIGRERDIAAVTNLLTSTRLLTLTGAGGCGKTRLAIKVATQLLASYPDGVYLIELSDIHDPALVPQTIASALGIVTQDGTNQIGAIADHLFLRHILLVLDNCEHLTTPLAELVSRLLTLCPELCVIATSREVFRVDGEVAFRVPSLSLPDPNEPTQLASLLRFEATRLFVERASAALPEFSPHPAEVQAIYNICIQLDGIPLAIELAAVRVRMMDVREIERQLDDRFRLLTTGSRANRPRQQTLRALVDWSYDLLTGGEQSLLRHLSVFHSGFTLEAATALGLSEQEEQWVIINQLGMLVDKSLVLHEAQPTTTRYRLLETIRQYGMQRLIERDEEPAAMQRYSQYYLQLARNAADKLNGSEQRDVLATLEREHENLRTAISWSLIAEPDDALELAGLLWLFWYMLGYLSEGRKYLTAALATGAGNYSQQARALNGAGVLAWSQGDYSAARCDLEQSLSIYRQLADEHGIAQTLHNMGNVAADIGDYAQARAFYAECLALNRELGDRYKVAAALANLGAVTSNAGEYQLARPLYEEALVILREVGNEWAVAAALHNLGEVEMLEGNYPAARNLYSEGLTLMRALGDRRNVISSLKSLGTIATIQGDLAAAQSALNEGLRLSLEIGDRQSSVLLLEAFADLYLVRGELTRAVKTLGTADRLREVLAYALQPAQCRRREHIIAETHARLGGRVWATTWAEGRATNWSSCADEALIASIVKHYSSAQSPIFSA